jgi:NADPH:quinone reductase-like Zn-dependent oxidoreductase
MPKAVRFEQYGGVEVLQVVEVPRPIPGPGQVLIAVKAAGINPGEASIRRGLMASRFPATFPSGQGSDFAGVVAELGADISSYRAGDEVIGFTNQRASQATYVVVPATQLTPRPANVPWEAAGSLFVAGTTAYAAIRAVGLTSGDWLVVSGAAGGVGSITVQLAVHRGAHVIGLASPAHHQWLAAHGVLPVAHGEEVAEHIASAAGARKVDAFVDTYGASYVELALQLGVRPERIDTIANFEAAAKYGVKAEGNAAAANAEVLAELADLLSQGALEIPIANVYPLDEVQEAYREVEQRHTLGKIVLVP